MMTDQLTHHIKQLLPGYCIPEEDMAPFFQEMTVKRGTVLLQEGVCCDRIYFVNKGCLYLHYEFNRREVAIHFALENWWITDYKTFVDGKPAVYALTAMEDAEITSINRSDYDRLLLQFPMIALYFNKIHERAYGAALFKQKTYATVSKRDFYNHFRNSYPALIKRIPDAIFASYMGVSIEVLKTLESAYIS